ncbi:hypothetical protein RHRU231_390088 [Rhodococcus ruber]|uniref:Uncharacterized protein n=1 Tax=Rhodococcus ruber TaxID=1830 RepID=A0A098BKC8_9NOCA|nr:hypothetical protein RHRU231_390088 [Rhodococcus ruber]
MQVQKQGRTCLTVETTGRPVIAGSRMVLLAQRRAFSRIVREVGDLRGSAAQVHLAAAARAHVGPAAAGIGGGHQAFQGQVESVFHSVSAPFAQRSVKVPPE